MSGWRHFCVALVLLAGGADVRGDDAGKTTHIPPPAKTGSSEADFFESKIRPLLAARCGECHGSQKQEMGVRFDKRDAFFRGGDDGAVVQAGEPEKSLLIQAVRQTGDVKMPPKSKLPDDEIALLTEWVKLGMPWPEDVKKAASDSGIAEQAKQHWAYQPVRAVEPPTVSDNAWSTSAIDRFVLAKLEAAGLKPSPAADKRTLVRRAYFDLIGLPPTPEQTAAFLADETPDAFQKVVDRLLESPQYGERWARYWLDVARYADTKGYVFEEERKYPFAYNYRDWVVESLNADLPYDQFVAQQIAADLLPRSDDRSLAALGFLTLGRRFLNNRHDIIDDRLDVVFRGTQAMTVSCARCHDHKFDPIPTDDYYSLYGVLDSSVDKTVQLEPSTAEYDAELKTRKEVLASFVAEGRARLSGELKSQTAKYLLAALRKGDAAKKDKKADAKDKPVQIVVVRWQNFLEAQGKRSPGVWGPFEKLAVESDEDFSARLQAALMGELNPILRAKLEVEQPVSLEQVAECYASVLQDVDRQWQEKLKSAEGGKTPAKLDEADAEELRQVFYGEKSPVAVSEGDLGKLLSKEKQAEQKKRTEAVAKWEGSPEAPRQALVVNDTKPKKPRVFVRGNPNKPGKEVPRQFVAVLAGDNRTPFKNGSGRLELAERIASPTNPLTARVMVNRVWMYHFGSPLVATPSDFGLRSDAPTHPELLDYLAREFMNNGWSLKRLHRDIMLSQTYLQASFDRPECQAVDPENRLLWKMNRRRLDWEAFRDALLIATGEIDLKVGGPAVDVFAQPFSRRRSIYGFIDRQNLPGVFRTFDLASPDTHNPRRFSTTVPQQALYLMNNGFVVDQAKRLANREDVKALPEGNERVQRLFAVLWGRAATSEELAAADEFLKREEEAKEGSKKLGRWEQFAQALLMTNEFDYVD